MTRASDTHRIAAERAIRRLKPDIVHTWIFAAGSYGRVGASAGVKIVQESQGQKPASAASSGY